MEEGNQDAAINGLFDKVCVLDGGRKLHIKRVFADGLLEITCLREHKQFMVQDEATGQLRFPDVSWLETVLREGRLSVPDTGVGTSTASAVALEMDPEQILQKDPYAKVRRDLLRAVATSGVSPSDPALGLAVKRIWLEQCAARTHAIAVARPDVVQMKCPAPSTVRTWLRKLDPIVATLGEVMHRTGLGHRAPRLDPDALEALEEIVAWYYDRSGYRPVDARPELHANIDRRNLRRAEEGLKPLPYPGKETLRRYIARGLNRDSFARKFGEKAARQRWDGQGQSLSASKILSVCLIDDTVLDAVAVFDANRGIPAGRPWLTVLMDVHARCILGWMLDFVPPNHHTAAEVLRRANRPKSIRPDKLARHPVLAKINGKPDLLIADNGTGFASAAFQQVCQDLGITLQLAPAGAPRAKAMLERFFFTLKTFLLEKLPGYTHTPALLREFDIDPEKTAALTQGELTMLVQNFVDSYHITEHSSLGVPPALKWQVSMAANGRNMILDERRFDISTGVTLHSRRFYRGAIRAFGLTFRDASISRELNDELVGAEPHRRRVKSGAVVATVRIKYNPANLRSVFVWNHVSKRWVELPCTDLEYADGLTLWQHRQIKAWAKRRSLAFTTVEERMEARRQLNELIVELAPGMPSRERRAVARMLGQPASPDLQVTVEEAEPTHAGMSPVIENSTNEDRDDAHIKPHRPSKKKKEAPTADDDDTEDEETTVDESEPQDGAEIDTNDSPPPVNGSDDTDSGFEEWN